MGVTKKKIEKKGFSTTDSSTSQSIDRRHTQSTLKTNRKRKGKKDLGC